MSLVGQVDWYFQVTVCARETCGMATAAAPVMAAPARNLRRVAHLGVSDCSVLMGIALLGSLWFPGGILGAACDMNRPDRFPIPVGQVVRGDIAPHKARIVSPHPMDHSGSSVQQSLRECKLDNAYG